MQYKVDNGLTAQVIMAWPGLTMKNPTASSWDTIWPDLQLRAQHQQPGGSAQVWEIIIIHSITAQDRTQCWRDELPVDKLFYTYLLKTPL